jgi:uncharacterized protein (DUF983 family)
MTKSLQTILTRGLKLECPVCGLESLVERPFHIRHHCRSCSALFKREDGFFVGAILANVVTTELIILAVCFFALLVLGVDYDKVLWLLFTLAVIFPLAFYHHSWSLWLAFDHLVEGLPKFKSR